MMMRVDQYSEFIARDLNLRTYANRATLDFSTPENSIRQQISWIFEQAETAV